MKKNHIKLSILLLLFCNLCVVNSQAKNSKILKAEIQLADSTKIARTKAGKELAGNWKKTGATFTISGSELEHMATSNLLNALNGRLPGLTVISGSGETGYDSPSFAIHGQSSWNTKTNNMLVYLDGFEVDMGALSSLSANEVESVSVVSDATELAKYGFSADGVITVITKKGKVNKKPIISFHSRYGMQSAVELPTVLNAYDYTRLYNQARQNDGLPIKYANPDLYKNPNDPIHPNVDWYNEMLKSSAPIQNYNISFRGGSDKAQYFLILDHVNNEGLYKNANEIDKDYGTNALYKKYNLRANIAVQLSKNFSIKSELSGKIEDRNTPAGFTASTLFANLLNTPSSSFPVKNPNGTWATNSDHDFNPVELLKQAGVYNGHTRNMQANITFVEKLDMLTPGLALNGGVSFSNQYMGAYLKSFTVPTYELTKDANDNPITDASGNYVYKQHGAVASSISDGEVSHWNRSTYQLGLDYNRSFGLHSVSAMVQAKRQNYSYNGLVYEYRTQGISSAVSYDYAKKYVLNVSLGYMGTDNLGDAKHYGLFPSVGAGWVISNEEFLKDNGVIDFLKIRGSFSSTGSLDQDYRFNDKQWAVNNSAGWNVGTTSVTYKSGRSEGAIGNPNTSWETKKSFNLGIETTILKYLTAMIDIFSEKRTGIIQRPSAEVPSYAGFNLPYLNTGKVSNKGFDATLRYDGKVSDFEYYVGTNVSFARNKIDYMSEVAQPYSYLYATGYRIDQSRGLQCLGYYQTSDFDASGSLNKGVVKSSYANVKPGDLKYKDQNNDGIINDYDKVPMKYSKLPEWTMGLNVGFKYKGFDLDAFFEGVTNRTVVMPASYTQPFAGGNNITPFSLNSWTPETALTATSPRLTTQTNLNNTQSSDFWMKDGSFIKLRSLEVGYTLPQVGFLKKINSIRVYANGTNLFIWDKIDSLEAENLSMGYPLMKSVSLGLNIVF